MRYSHGVKSNRERLRPVSSPPEEMFPGRKEAHLTSPTSQTPAGNWAKLSSRPSSPTEKEKMSYLFTFLPLLKTSDACFSFTSWLLSASSSSEHRPCEVDPQTRLPPLSEHHEGTHTEPLLAEDFHNKSPAGQRVRQIKPTKSPENVHILQKYIFKKFTCRL